MRSAIAIALISAVASAQNPGPSGPIKPASFAGPAGKPLPIPAHDTAQMSPVTRRVHVSARAGSEWLLRADNPTTGRFVPGWSPALNSAMEQDNYLDQAQATIALARSARYFGNERHLMKARQAVLSLLAETQADPADPNSRCCTLPALVVHPLAAAGLVLAAIHELHDPAEDLVRQGEELATFIRKAQLADGSFAIPAERPYAGMALCGLALSQRNRPATWKSETLNRAVKFYGSVNVFTAGTPWLISAFSEHFVQSKDRAAAGVALAMADRMCELQYGVDSRNSKWTGGFRPCVDGKLIAGAPDATSAIYLQSLCQACLVTRHVPDAGRYARYMERVGPGVEFLAGLQYSENSTLHFTPGYRIALIGGFHTSQEDGNLLVRHQAQCVSAMIEYLTATGAR